MRITRDLLHKFAREHVKKRQRSDLDLLAAYLTGSLLEEEPLLGGSTDIDLVLVHKFQTPTPREAIPWTPEVSLDVYHTVQDAYDQHKQLRHDPWLGYPLTRNHILLFDTNHWLEFIQAGVSAQFQRPDNVLTRAAGFSGVAREGWFALAANSPRDSLTWLNQFLTVLSQGAQAVAALNGPPLTTRRFLLTLSEQTEILGVPQIYAGVAGLLGAATPDQTAIAAWREALEKDLSSLAETTLPPVHLASCRHAYYLNAILALAEGGYPAHAVWPLLRVWLDVRLALAAESSPDTVWEDCLAALNLHPEMHEKKTEALDAFLDTVEITLETWADAYGL
jgi:hypothetical protein